jgi:subtilase family serine protease
MRWGLVILIHILVVSFGGGFVMRKTASFGFLVPILLGMSVIGGGTPAAAQPPGRQITSPIDDSSRVTLAGNTRPEARAKKNDHGAVPDTFAMAHMQLLLRRSPAQERTLEQLIDQLHDRNSPNYHHWLSSSEFGQEFGLGSEDVQSVTGWLTRHGFQINAVYTNRMTIDFSGTAAQVREAFNTSIHYLSVKGVKHVANISDPQIPSALAAAVTGVVSLNDFRPNKLYRPRPKYTFKEGTFTYQAVVPADLAKIYNLTPLFTSGITGKGETIVVIEDSDVYATADWTTFRSTFGLSSYASGSLTTVHPNTTTSHSNCVDPRVNGDDGEAILDAEWASAAAPNAAIELASCADTSTTFGGLIALQNILNSPNPPPIVSISYGQCEAYNGAAANAAYYAAYQQAVAEGVSVFVAAGDENAASCDAGQWVSFQGIAVSGMASTPYNVAVGGTDFGDSYAKTNSTYWSSTNTSTYGSALSYVPEIPWNDSCASTLVAKYLGATTTYGSLGFCNTGAGSELWEVVGGSGGPSNCAFGATSQQSAAAASGTCSGYPKPSWQKLLGNPNDGARDIPDVSLFAADGLWGHYYVICYSDERDGGAPCTGAPSNWAGAGGTSFSSPIMAGIQALVDQKLNARQGNPNPVLYTLAATEYGVSGNAACNSTLGKTVASTCVFYDVTLGDNDVNCASAQDLELAIPGLTYLGPVNCYAASSNEMGVLSTSNTAYAPAYAATKGWDFSTGIGTINAYNLVKAWP